MGMERPIANNTTNLAGATGAGETSVRGKFVELFGEQQVAAIEQAANEHDNDVHGNRGSDPFKWALSIAIGYECLSNDSYRDHHGITIPWGALKTAIIEHGALASHDGDVDYLSVFAGTYNEFVKIDEVRP